MGYLFYHKRLELSHVYSVRTENRAEFTRLRIGPVKFHVGFSEMQEYGREYTKNRVATAQVSSLRGMWTWL